MSSKPTLSTSASQEVKEAVQEYAVSRGFKRTSDFVWYCIVKTIRATPPKKGTALQKKLDTYLQ